MSSKVIFCFLLVFLMTAQAQENRSVHQMHKAVFHVQPEEGALYIDKNANAPIIPLQFDKSAVVGKSVFGYLPDWEVLSSSAGLRYDLLTHLAVFDFAMDSLGNLKNPAYWPWTTVINTAHAAGVKVILCVTNFEGSEITYFLDRPTARQNFFNQAAAKLAQYSFDGINIDFESLRVSDRGTRINTFMTELTAFLKAGNPALEVSFAGPAVNWSGWNLLGLAQSCDYIFIMGYDFYGSWSSTTGANAPLTGGNYNITNTVNVQYGQAVAAMPEKLILGVPYFGVEWNASSASPYTPVLDYIGHPRYRIAEPNAQLYGLLWDAISKTAWFRYQNGTTWRQVWYDNDSSLAMKYDLALSKNLKGVGIWALGYDRGRNELWNLLQRKIFDPTAVNGEIQPTNFQIESAYPNPFNPVTSLRISSHFSGECDISVYSLLGERVLTKVADISPGANTVSLDLGAFASGSYIVLATGRFEGRILNSAVKIQLLK